MDKPITREELARLHEYMQKKAALLPIDLSGPMEETAKRANAYIALANEYMKEIQKAHEVFSETYPEEDMENIPDANSLENYIIKTILGDYAPVPLQDLPAIRITSKRFMYAMTSKADPEKPFLLKGDIGELIKTLDKAKEEEANELMSKWIQKETGPAIGEFDPIFLESLVSVFARWYLEHPAAPSVTLKISDLGKWLGVDVRGEIPEENNKRQKRFDLFDRINQARQLVGYNPKNGMAYQVLNIETVSAMDRTVTLSSPWIRSIIASLDHDREENEHAGITELIKPEAVGARQTVTMQIVERIVIGLVQRGNAPDKKLKKDKEFKSNAIRSINFSLEFLAKEVPEFGSMIENADYKHRNETLKRCLYGSDYAKRIKNNEKSLLEEYIEKYTFLHECYKNLTITIPEKLSVSNLRASIKITHKGKRGDFEYNTTLNGLKFSNDGEISE